MKPAAAVVEGLSALVFVVEHVVDSKVGDSQHSNPENDLFKLKTIK